jgi:hypothetical protein
MNNDAGHYEFYLAVEGDAADEERDRQRIQLQTELNDLEGVARVSQISAGKAPAGTRAIDLVVIGGLAVALKQAGVFDAVVRMLKAWIESGNRRKEKRKVVIKRPDGIIVEFDGYSLREIGGFPDTGGKA